MSNDQHIQAIDELGRRFEIALSTRRRGWRRARRYGAVAGVMVVAISAPALALSGAFQFGDAMPAPGEPGGAPALLRDIPDNETIDVLAVLARPGGADEAKRQLAAHGVRLEVSKQPVAPGAVGRMLGMSTSTGVRMDDRHRAVLGHGTSGTISVTIGRRALPGEEVGTTGLSIDEVLPQVRRAVVRADPRGSIERLRALGFEVKLMHIIDNPNRDKPGGGPTGWRPVGEVPEGTVVLSVNADEGTEGATAQTRKLLMEVAPADSEIAREHHVPAG